MAEAGPDRTAGMKYVAVGIEFGTTIGLSVIAGYYLDGYLGTQPICTLLLTFAGMFGALRRLIWSLKRHTSR
jgi:F0F1-type ATP synthase assembly protein I